MDKKEFLKAVQACRRKMNIALFMEKTVSALSIGAAAGILFQAAAFCSPLLCWSLCRAGAVFCISDSRTDIRCKTDIHGAGGLADGQFRI